MDGIARPRGDQTAADVQRFSDDKDGSATRALWRKSCPYGAGVVNAANRRNRHVCLEDAALPIVKPSAGERL